MLRIVSVAFVVALSVTACGRSAGPPPAEPTAALPLASRSRGPTAVDTTARDDIRRMFSEIDAKPEIAADVGDYVVQRFSGSFAAQPLVLTERVTAREGDIVVADLALADGKTTTVLRVRIDPAADEVKSVSLVEDGKERPADKSAYEALLARITFAADENLGETAHAEEICLLGDDMVSCEKTKYRVLVGDKEAELEVSRSDALLGRDLGGLVRQSDGKVLYRAEVIEVGNDAPKPSLASR